MKRCPRCGQGYTDSTLNFCLNDGELLMQYEADEPKTLFADKPPSTQFEDDSPPTVAMNPARVTGQANWTQGGPPVEWQRPHLQNMPNTGMAVLTIARDQTLPTIALILGIMACLSVCCFGGVYLGIPAAIIGFLAMRNTESDPTRYGGRGMAVAGLVLGIVTGLISFIHLIFALVA